MQQRRAPSAAYRANLVAFINDLGAFARDLDAHKRLARYAGLLGVFEKAKTKRNPLADHTHCVTLVAAMVEALRELTVAMPTESEVSEALAECGVANATAIVSSAWRGSDRFHAEWLRLLPNTEPLGEALRRVG